MLLGLQEISTIAIGSHSSCFGKEGCIADLANRWREELGISDPCLDQGESSHYCCLSTHSTGKGKCFVSNLWYTVRAIWIEGHFCRKTVFVDLSVQSTWISHLWNGGCMWLRALLPSRPCRWHKKSVYRLLAVGCNSKSTHRRPRGQKILRLQGSIYNWGLSKGPYNNWYCRISGAAVMAPQITITNTHRRYM